MWATILINSVDSTELGAAALINKVVAPNHFPIDVDPQNAKKVLGDPLYGFIKNHTLSDFFSFEYLMSSVMIMIRIMIIVAICLFFWKWINKILDFYFDYFIKKRIEENNSFDKNPLVKTVIPIIRGIVRWFLLILGLLLILGECHVDATSIMYSLGMFSLALSIGAQTLVKDLINGMLTLFEGSMSVGDVVKIKGGVGTVETISLRCIHLRHANGELETIPFSQVTPISNLSKDFRLACVTIPISLSQDMNGVREIISETFQNFKEKIEIQSLIKDEKEDVFIKNITEAAVYICITFKTSPDPFDKISAAFYENIHNTLIAKNIFPPPPALC